MDYTETHVRHMERMPPCRRPAPTAAITATTPSRRLGAFPAAQQIADSQKAAGEIGTTWIGTPEVAGIEKAEFPVDVVETQLERIGVRRRVVRTQGTHQTRRLAVSTACRC